MFVTLISFGMGISFSAYLKLKWNSKFVDLEAPASALKFHTSAFSRFPYLLGGLVAIYTCKAGCLLAGKPVWWIHPSGVWVISGWLCFPFKLKYFAAFSTAARPAPAAAQVTLSPCHHYRQSWLIIAFPCSCLSAFLSLPFMIFLCVYSLGRISGEYFADYWEHDELKFLEWDKQRQLWNSAALKGVAVPAPALPLLPSVKPRSAASRKKCSIWASEDLQWAHEQGGSGLGPHWLTGSALPAQKCLLLPKFGLEQPFPGTTKTTMLR